MRNEDSVKTVLPAEDTSYPDKSLENTERTSECHWAYAEFLPGRRQQSKQRRTSVVAAGARMKCSLWRNWLY